MVKKLQKMAEKKAAGPAAALLDSQLAQTVKDSAQQIWLAGLGAFAKAQGEGGKVFDTLMREGASLQRKTQAVAEEKLGDMASKVTAMAGGVGNRANAQWDKLESIFEERTSRALGRLGMPSARDLTELLERVQALEAAVTKLGGELGKPAPAKPEPKPRASRKRAAPVAEAPAAAPAQPARKAAAKRRKAAPA